MKQFISIVCFWVLMGFFSPGFLLSADLKVIRTAPENGRRDVDPSLREILITFSGAVKQNSGSLLETDRGEFPASTGDPLFRDERTCVLPVRLKPGTTYSVGINSQTKKGFRSAADERVSVIHPPESASYGSPKRSPAGGFPSIGATASIGT